MKNYIIAFEDPLSHTAIHCGQYCNKRYGRIHSFNITFKICRFGSWTESTRRASGYSHGPWPDSASVSHEACVLHPHCVALYSVNSATTPVFTFTTLGIYALRYCHNTFHCCDGCLLLSWWQCYCQSLVITVACIISAYHCPDDWLSLQIWRTATFLMQ